MLTRKDLADPGQVLFSRETRIGWWVTGEAVPGGGEGIQRRG